MILLNFSHPITPPQLQAVEGLVGPVDRVQDVETHLEHGQPFATQVKALVDSVGLSPTEWQTTPLLVNLPSLSVIAALVLAELHGRMGHFPAVLRLRPVPGSTPPQFEVAEVLNLQAVRDAARAGRSA
jgi:hypothetical protein